MPPARPAELLDFATTPLAAVGQQVFATMWADGRAAGDIVKAEVGPGFGFI